MVNFVDQMGSMFTSPVMVPYGKALGADLQTIALFATVRGIAAIFSNFWLAWFGDKFGQRPAVIFSVAGCTLGYGIQAASGLFRDADGSTAVVIFMIGRGVSGLFCGVTPVLQAYVCGISAYDQSVMSQRMVNLMVAGQALGIALSPISGALASFGLTYPFIVSMVCGLLGTLWCIFLFPSSEQVKELGRGPDAVPSELLLEKPNAKVAAPRPSQSSELLPGEYANHPIFDRVTVLLTLAYIFLMVFVQGLIFIIPLELALPSFGLGIPGDDDATQGNIAKASGLVAIPRGICSCLVSIFLFGHVVRRFGQIQTVASCAALNAAFIVGFGFWITRVWQFIPFMAVLGISSGFVVPALSPLSAKYARAHYPRRQSQAQSWPTMGMNLSNAFAQNVLALVFNSFDDQLAGFHAAWCFVAICMVCFTVCFILVSIMVEARDHKKVEMASARISSTGEDAEKMKLRELHEHTDPDIFFEELVIDMRKQYQSEKENLWHGSAQLVYKRRVLAAVPKLPKWESDGAEHLAEVYKMMKAYPKECAQLQESFPSLSGMMDLPSSEHGLIGAGATTAGMAPSRKKLQRAQSCDQATSLQPLAQPLQN